MFKEGMLQVLGVGIYETLYMTLISTLMSYVIGLPLGLALVSTDKEGHFIIPFFNIKIPIIWFNKLLGFVVNVLRSVPFLILLIASYLLYLRTSFGSQSSRMRQLVSMVRLLLSVYSSMLWHGSVYL